MTQGFERKDRAFRPGRMSRRASLRYRASAASPSVRRGKFGQEDRSRFVTEVELLGEKRVGVSACGEEGFAGTIGRPSGGGDFNGVVPEVEGGYLLRDDLSALFLGNGDLGFDEGSRRDIAGRFGLQEAGEAVLEAVIGEGVLEGFTRIGIKGHAQLATHGLDGFRILDHAEATAVLIEGDAALAFDGGVLGDGALGEGELVSQCQYLIFLRGQIKSQIA